MPITPKFNVSQTDEFVVVKIKVPFVKISATELHCEGCDFTFYCRPYLLKIRLPFSVVDDERCRASIDLGIHDIPTFFIVTKPNISNTSYPNVDFNSTSTAIYSNIMTSYHYR